MFRTMRQKARKIWISTSINKKISFFVVVMFSIVSISVIFDFWLVGFSMNQLKAIYNDNARIIDLIDAIEYESASFEKYIKNQDDDTYTEYTAACKSTEQVINQLPYDYGEMNEARYAKTWSIKNSYDVYKQQRNRMIDMEEQSVDYIKELYITYDMQSYIQEYARALMRYTLEDGTVIFAKNEKSVRGMAVTVLIFEMVLLIGLIWLARVMKKSIISPIMMLGKAAKRITKNEFFVPDVVVDNDDEIGGLVRLFNKMKYATGQYITALEEKRKTMDLLHEEERHKLEMENRLEAMKFELLKNQINPHFLFNALNVIGSMANLEDAATTETMIMALSSLFRYNLKTIETEVLLSQELAVIEDYMYLQKMRFGERISYQIICDVDREQMVVPPFILQPLVENSIMHGLARKEDGGKIIIRISMVNDMLSICVEDTGNGISAERLDELTTALKAGRFAEAGIGLGNLYRRICGLYQNGAVNIMSEEGKGTKIQLLIPQEEGRSIDVSNTGSRG